MSRRPLSRVMFRSDSPVQTLPGSPNGQHTEHHHVATKSVVLELDDVTGIIYIRGYGHERAAHVSGTKEMDFVVEPAKKP